jgi:hypothetical protein
MPHWPYGSTEAVQFGTARRHVDRQSALALFDTFASKEKKLHANSGDHRDVRWFGVDDSFLAGPTRRRPDVTGTGVRLRAGLRHRCHILSSPDPICTPIGMCGRVRRPTRRQIGLICTQPSGEITKGAAVQNGGYLRFDLPRRSKVMTSGS